MTAGGVMLAAFLVAVLAQVAILFLTAPLHDRLTRLYEQRLLAAPPVLLSSWGRLRLGGMSYILSLPTSAITSRGTMALLRLAQALVATVVVGLIVSVGALIAQSV